jgi:ribosome-binding factor A
VAEQVRRELASLIREELDDRRLVMVSITEVKVSRDYGHAKVFVTYLGAAEERRRVVEELNEVAGFLRGALGRRIRIRTVPRLHFHYDESVERGAQLSALIDEAVGEDAARHDGSPDDTEAPEPKPEG